MSRERIPHLTSSASRLALLSGAAATLGAPAASAAWLDTLLPPGLPALFWFDPRSAIGLAVLTGLIIFATTLSILHVRERRRWTDHDRDLAAENAALRAALDEAQVWLGAETQFLVTWSGPAEEPSFSGDPAVAGPGAGPKRVLAFGTWLVPGDAGRLETGLARLRERGELFALTLRTTLGRFVEAEGRTVAGQAILRLREITGERGELLRSREGERASRAELATLRALLDALPEAVWLRDADGRLAWANKAYCAAVEAAGPDAVAARSLELLDRSDREEARRRRMAGEVYRARVAAIVAGSRRVLDITEASLPPSGEGGAVVAGGLAKDVSELEAVRSDLGLQMQAHVRMLDQLPTAVATFDGRQRLVFHNAAYRQLWALDGAFLAGQPTEGEILDTLRAAQRLPEQADYRSWKAARLEAYRSADPGETWWHLPDGRTLRVVTNPVPGGGLTFLFDDLSDRMALESRMNALTRVQGETLDALAEGVALFGSDGRVKLSNRAFARLWQLDEAAVAAGLHVDGLVEAGRRLAPADGPWAELRGAVAGLSEMRLRSTVRMERLDGSVLDAAADPLPDGGTLLTFVDVTASVNVERALLERNEALETGARLRNEFVHHVSYELRSPLTNIIGFAELLGAETAGPLNEGQRDYAGHITRSSGALLAIINDILDLASIDTDTIEIAHERVDILATIEAAAAGIRDRLAEAALRLEIDAPADIGSFTGDSKRVRQVLYNLLSNAAGFSARGQTIRVAARKNEDAVILSVADEGRGIPDDVKARVFDRFLSRTAGTAHRGVGLGLSIVRSFVELHGGRVELASEPGAGTTVTCYFPTGGRPARQLAASLPDADPQQAGTPS